MKYTYKTKGTCSYQIQFDIENDIVTNICFFGGCNGNLKAISKLLNGWHVGKIIEVLKGNTCGFRSTSCADQLATALEETQKERNPY